MCVCVCLFRAAPMACGGFQARGQIGVVPTGLRHSNSNTRSEPRLQPAPQLLQRLVLNPLSHQGTPVFFIYLFIYFYIIYFILFFIFWSFFAISWAAPAAYGGSQARGWIGAVATGLRQRHSNAGSEPRLQPTPQLTAMPDVNPLSKGRDRTRNLMVPSRIP